VVERFRDELGDWRVVIHSPFGSPVHAPWALAVAARMRERFGVDVQAMHGDDGIVLRLPDLDLDIEVGGDGPAAVSTGGSRGSNADALTQELLDLILLDPDEVADLVTAQVGGSALFAARFRECAARALLLPRRRPDRRQALWQQRQRASQLLEVASQYPSFPIVLEAVRECVQDVFDVPGLVALMRAIRSREVGALAVQTSVPSPFARSLLFGYVAQYLYEGDSPLAERRAAALALDPTLLAELLGTGEGLSLRDLLDPAAVAATEAELQRLVPERAARDTEDLADLIRVLGPLDLDGLVARSTTSDARIVSEWLVELEVTRRVIRVRIGGQERWAAVEDAGRLRDALGVSLPVGVPEAFLAPLPDPLGDLVARFARSHGPFGVSAVSSWLGLGPAVVRDALRRLVAAGRLVEGELRPEGSPDAAGAGRSTDFCDAGVLRTLRRRSLAALRAEVEPVGPADYARFLPAWQGVGGSLRGPEGLLRAVEQLGGAVLPASALESLVLPSRVTAYQSAWLDELLAAGEVLWQGHGSLPGDDGWVSLHLADLAPVTMTAPTDAVDLGPVHAAILDCLSNGGAFFFRTLADAVSATVGPTTDDLVRTALWELVWGGRVSGDTLAPLRALLGGGRTAHRRRPTAGPRGRYAARSSVLGRGAAGLGWAGDTTSGGPARTVRAGSTSGDVVGRWALLPARESDPTVTAYTRAEVLLDRYGVLTRGSVAAEDVPGGFAGVYRVLAAAEESGRVRRGYFIEGLGAAQFGSTGAVDRLRAGARPLGDAPRSAPPALVLAACDPANPYGAALSWPTRDPVEGGGRGHQPARKAGALVVLVDGELVLYVERGGRSLLTWSEDPTPLQAAADALALAVREGVLGKLTVERTDGTPVLRSEHALTEALAQAGFHATPRGLRLRR
ncbi:MAG TPA: crosslink repair DNA glycosylase YcaQ family protein, partial [Dermatophilaceae bacterium]|nr:crosslink repair DNA glycosylase YcaQ family protein [Dermatophilaceae bacterium]